MAHSYRGHFDDPAHVAVDSNFRGPRSHTTASLLPPAYGDNHPIEEVTDGMSCQMIRPQVPLFLGLRQPMLTTG